MSHLRCSLDVGASPAAAFLQREIRNVDLERLHEYARARGFQLEVDPRSTLVAGTTTDDEVILFSDLVACQLLAQAPSLNTLCELGLTVVGDDLSLPGFLVCRATRVVPRTQIRALMDRFRFISVEQVYPRTDAHHGGTAGEGQVQDHIAILRCEKAWGRSRGENVTISVIDVGFDLTTTTLGPQFRTGGFYWSDQRGQFEFAASHQDYPVETWHNHGTDCAVLAVGADRRSSSLGTGIAPEATFAPIALGPNVSQIKLAIALCLAVRNVSRAGSPAAVVSCSIAPGESNGELKLSTPLKAVLDWLQTQNVLLLYAVSNHSGSEVTNDEMAVHPATISCGALNTQLQLNSGAYPPDLFAVIGGSSSTGVGDEPLELPNKNSYAAPVAAGVSALALSASGAKASSIRQILTQDAGPQCISGVKVLDALHVVEAAIAARPVAPD